MDLRFFQFVFIVAQIHQSQQQTNSLTLTDSVVSSSVVSLPSSVVSSVPSSSVKTSASSSSFTQTTQSSESRMTTATTTLMENVTTTAVNSMSISQTEPKTPSTPTESLQQTSSSSLELQTTNSQTASQTPSPSNTVDLKSTSSQGVSSKSSSPSRTTGFPTNRSQSSRLSSEWTGVTVATSSSPAAPVAPTTTSSSSTVQSVVPTPSLSLNWTNWDVKKEDCDATCNNVGGTVEASRQCHSHTETLEPSVCAQHNSITRNVKCKDYCPTSGTEVFRSLLSNVAAGALLVMLSEKFV